jgi:predicted ATP-grasp superfamily ATP-dependent carboligase
MKKIIFIESSDIGARYTAQAARQLGFQPLFICDLEKVQGDTYKQLLTEEQQGNLIVADTTSLESICAALQDQNIDRASVAGVMTFLDSRIEIAIGLGKVLNVPAQLDSQLLQLKSKGFVQNLIPEFSPPSIVFKSTEVPYSAIEAFFANCKQVIVKPTKMAGGVGAIIFDKSTYLQIGESLKNQNISPHLDDGDWICQAFIEGSLFSVEGFVEDGQVQVLGVSDRAKVGFSESRLEFPSESKISPKQTEAFKEALQCLVRRSQLNYGFFHVEFLVEGQNCFIIDANMGRLGGGPLGEMIAIAYGGSTSDFYAFVILKCLGNLGGLSQSPSFDTYKKTLYNTFRAGHPERISTVGVCYGSPQDGFFTDICGVSQAGLNHTLVLNTHQMVNAMGANNWSWIGIASGPKDTFETNFANFKIKIDCDWRVPCY